MNKKYSEMNDFDKIILSHQENNDDIEELSNFRNEKWKALDIERAKKPSEYLSKERLPTMLRYLIIEDMSNKRWFIYDSDISRTYFIDFGEYTLFLLNDILGYLPDFPYHKQKRKEALNFITEEDYEDTKNIICDNKEKFIELFETLSTFDGHKKSYNEFEMSRYSYGLWLRYRYLCYVKNWTRIIHDRDITKADVSKLKYQPDDKEKFIECCHESAEELEEYLHHTITGEFFIYHDFMSCIISDGSIISGNAYIARDIKDIFPLDLLHVLKCDAKTPRKCPRCGQLYFSNNNKSKYCSECKANSNIIRQENRKNNPCRYLHKQITDILNNYGGDGSENFRIESNYYWAIVQGNTPKQIPVSYNPNITTRGDYFKWLQEQKIKAKTSPVN